MARKKQIKWGRPDKWEVLLLVMYGLFLYLFNDMVNLMSSSPEGWMATGTPISGIKIGVVSIMWFALIMYHIFLVALVTRSIWKKGTSHKLDAFVGGWMFLGVFAVIVPTVAMLTGIGPDATLPWLFGWGRITVYHVGLFVFQIPGLIYFAMTK